MTLDDILKTSLDPLGWLAMADLCEEWGEDPAFWRRLGEWGGKLLPVILKESDIGLTGRRSRAVEYMLDEVNRACVYSARKTIFVLVIGRRVDREFHLDRFFLKHLGLPFPDDISPEKYMIRRLCDICFVSQKPLILP